MSCIVGIVKDGRVHMGADSAGVNGRGELDLRVQSKVFRVADGSMLLGVAGSWLVGDVLQQSTVPRPNLEGACDRRALVRGWVMGALNAAERPDIKSENYELLIGVKGQLFRMWKDNDIAEERCGFDACGSGAQIAKGALAALANIDWGPEVKLSTALWAAERFCVYVREPFTIEQI